MKRFVVATLAVGLLALAGCVTIHENDHDGGRSRGGPPPWAPAHGYRHHHQDGLDLAFDARLGVYVVVGYPHVYFHDGHYFRHVSSSWERCGSWKKGRWKRVEVDAVPVTLVKYYKKKGPKHGKAKGHGHGAAKHDDYDD